MAQGITGFAGGRPAVQPVVRLASCLVPKERAFRSPSRCNGAARRHADEHARRRIHAAADGAGSGSPRAAGGRERARGRSAGRGAAGAPRTRPQRRQGRHRQHRRAGAPARSSCRCWRRQLTAAAVRGYLAHLVDGEVERYDWPGLAGWNFVLHRALGGGGIASLRYDPQGKSYAQILMDMPVRVPAAWLEPAGLLGARREGARASARRRERLPRDERVAEIMRAARTVFCSKGYEAASTAEIAAQAGVVEGTLYRYFPTKRDLLIKVVEAVLRGASSADYEAAAAGRARHLEPPALHDLEAPERHARGAGHVPPHRPRAAPVAAVPPVEHLHAQPALHPEHARRRHGGHRQRRVPRRRAAADRARHDLRRRRAPHLGAPAG